MARHTRGDTALAGTVRAAIDRDPHLRFARISVEVHEGVAILTGEVRSHRERMAAARDAWAVEGVAEVRNQLQVEQEQPRPSEEIAEDLLRAVAEDGRVNPRDLVVEVAEGILRLSGTVATGQERLAAEEVAWQVEGVVEVANDITVSSDHRRPDGEIEEDVRSALVEDAGIADATSITARSTAGTVRLEGTVASAREREAAEKDAWYTAGVVYVENRLRIEGPRQKAAAA